MASGDEKGLDDDAWRQARRGEDRIHDRANGVRLAWDDPRQISELFERCILRNAQHGRVHQHERLGENFFADDLAFRACGGNGQLDAAAREQILQHRAALFPDLQMQLGVLSAE